MYSDLDILKGVALIRAVVAKKKACLPNRHFCVRGLCTLHNSSTSQEYRQLVAGLYLFLQSFFKSSADALSLLNDESYQGEEGNLQILVIKFLLNNIGCLLSVILYVTPYVCYC
jgi:hypothetical protein